MPSINPRYRCHKFCPECGAPLWETETPIHLKGRNRWGNSDMPDMGGGSMGGRDEDGMGWIHVFPFICDPCNKAYTLERTLSHQRPDTTFPDDYYLLGQGSDNRPESWKDEAKAG